MLLKYFLYFIVDESGRCYAVNNGLITATAVRSPIKFSPIGWEQISIAWERDFTRIGLIRNFTLPLSFVMDGAAILRKTFYEETIERKLFLLLQKLTLDLTDTTYNFRYNFFYKGELDFSTLKDEANKVTLSIAEGGIQKLFNANKDTVYEIPFDSDAITVKVDGLFLYETFNFLIPGINDSTVGFTHTTNGNFHHLIGINPTTQDGTAAGFAVFPVFYTDLPNTPTNSAQINLDFQNSLQYVFLAEQDINDVQIKGQVSVKNTTPTDADYALFLYKNDGTGITLAAGGISYNGFTTFDFDRTIDVKAGDKYFLIGSLGGFVEAIQYGETSVQINLHSRYKTTYCKAFKPLDLYKKLAAKMGIDPALCISTLLELHANIVLTCGNAIRALPGSAIKTSLSQFLDFSNVVLVGGFGFENGNMVIEDYAHFLNTAVVKDLGNAKDLVVSYATDLMANVIKVGYPDQQIDNVNGKYEFNNTLTFTTPITRVTRELTLVCPYLAQPYKIETLRLNLEGKTTTDNGSDNDTFILNVDLSQPISLHADAFHASNTTMVFTNAPELFNTLKVGDRFTLVNTFANDKTFTITSIVRIAILNEVWIQAVEPIAPETGATNITIQIPLYPLKRVTYTEITGLPADADVFNIEELTPKRLLDKHRLWINSINDGFAGQVLKYQTTEKNADLKTRRTTLISDETIEEKADVVIGTEKLFTPKYFDFENEVPVDLVEVLEGNPSTAFSFNWNAIKYTAFSKNVGIAPNTLREQSFKLLCAPNNDLKTLEL